MQLEPLNQLQRVEVPDDDVRLQRYEFNKFKYGAYLETHVRLLTTGQVLARAGDRDDRDVVVVALRGKGEVITLRNCCDLEMMCLTTMVVPKG